MARLTIPDEATVATFAVTTTQSVFPFSFAIFEKADLRVDVGGVEVLAAGFTLAGTLLEGGGYQGGTVTLNTPVAGTTATIFRNIRPERAEDFGSVTSVPVRTVDTALKRQMAISQDLDRRSALVESFIPELATLPGALADIAAATAAANAVSGAVAGKADATFANVIPATGRTALGVPSSAALALPSGGTLIRTIRTEAGAVVRTIQDVLRDRVSVKDFGAVGDGIDRPLSGVLQINGQSTVGWTLAQWQVQFPFVTSLTQRLDWAAHQAAVNTGKLVDVPAGTYFMGSSAVNVRAVAGNDGATIQGANWGATRWVFSGTTGDCFNFTGVTGAGIYDGTIDCSQTRVSGAAIHFASSNDLRSSGIRFKALSGGKFFDLYACEGAIGGGNQFLYKFDDYQGGDCVRGFRIGTTSTLVQDVWIGRGVVNDADEEGVLLLNCSGVFFHGWADFITCKHAVKTNPPTGQKVTAVLSSGFLADTSNNHGLHITTAGGEVSNINMTLWAATSGANEGTPTSALCNGVQIDQGAGLINGVRLSGEFFNNITCGIAIVAGSNVTIDGAMVGFNSALNVGGRAGIFVGAGAINTTISGVRSGRYGMFAIQAPTKPASQSYGIQIEAGALNTVVSGCNVTGNVVGGIINNGTGSVFSGVRGYRTKAELVGNITAGNSTSSVTIPIDPTLNRDRVKVIDGSGNRIVCSSLTGQVANFTAVTGIVPSTVFFAISVDQSEDFGPTYT